MSLDCWLAVRSVACLVACCLLDCWLAQAVAGLDYSLGCWLVRLLLGLIARMVAGLLDCLLAWLLACWLGRSIDGSLTWLHDHWLVGLVFRLLCALKSFHHLIITCSFTYQLSFIHCIERSEAHFIACVEEMCHITCVILTKMEKGLMPDVQWKKKKESTLKNK